MKCCEHLAETPENLKHNLYYWLPDGTELGYLCEECAIEQGVCPYCGQYEPTPDLKNLGACHECVEANTEYTLDDEFPAWLD